MFDKSRNRKIPVAYFSPKTSEKISKQQIVIFSHGYGANTGEII
jgi:cephalosporin-C deacetylase-like acetyl esterase